MEDLPHHIRLKDNLPVFRRQYRLSVDDHLFIENKVQSLIHKGVVEKCDSPYNSPSFLVVKPNICPGMRPGAVHPCLHPKDKNGMCKQGQGKYWC